MDKNDALKICYVFATLKYTQTNSPGDTTIFFTGLPTAKIQQWLVSEVFMGTGYTYNINDVKSGSAYFRTVINTSGQITNWYSSVTIAANQDNHIYDTNL